MNTLYYNFAYFLPQIHPYWNPSSHQQNIPSVKHVDIICKVKDDCIMVYFVVCEDMNNIYDSSLAVVEKSLADLQPIIGVLPIQLMHIPASINIHIYI